MLVQSSGMVPNLVAVNASYLTANVLYLGMLVRELLTGMWPLPVSVEGRM